MRFELDRLFKPVDPVVAVHPASRDADASLARLQRAGFRRANLTILGQSGATNDIGQLPPQPVGDKPHWAASGVGLGLLWTAFVCIAVMPHAQGSTAFGLVVAAGLLTLVLQTLVMGHVLVPGHAAASGETMLGNQGPTAASPATAWRFLVLVHGSRAEVALARDVLAMH